MPCAARWEATTSSTSIFKQRYDLQARIAEAEARGAATVVDGLRRCGHRAGIAVLDAAGHQMTDALLAAMIHQACLLGALYELDRYGQITTRLFENLNTRLYRSSGAHKFVSLLYGEVSEEGTFRFLSAGQPLPRVFSPRLDRFIDIEAHRRVSAPPLGIQPSLHVIDRAANESPFGFKDEYEVNEWALPGAARLGRHYCCSIPTVSPNMPTTATVQPSGRPTAQGEAPLGSRDMRGDPRRHACVQCAGRRHHAGDRQAGVEACGNGKLHEFQRRAAPDPLGPVVRRHTVIGTGPQPGARGSQRTRLIGRAGARDTRPRPASGRRPRSSSRRFQAALEHRCHGPRRPA